MRRKLLEGPCAVRMLGLVRAKVSDAYALHRQVLLETCWLDASSALLSLLRKERLYYSLCLVRNFRRSKSAFLSLYIPPSGNDSLSCVILYLSYSLCVCVTLSNDLSIYLSIYLERRLYLSISLERPLFLSLKRLSIFLSKRPLSWLRTTHVV